MKRLRIVVCTLIVGLLITSCITEKKKSSVPRLFDKYDAQEGFVILNIPPVLFKIVMNSDNDSIENPMSQEVFDNLDMLRVLIFDENDKSINAIDLSRELSKEITENQFVLLTSINAEGEKVSIYIKEPDQAVVEEAILLMEGDGDVICLNFIGEIDMKTMIGFASEFEMNAFNFDFD